MECGMIRGDNVLDVTDGLAAGFCTPIGGGSRGKMKRSSTTSSVVGSGMKKRGASV